MSIKTEKRIRRHKKIRMNMHGTKDRPRLFVFKSNQHIYAQLVDDDKNKILITISDKDLKLKKETLKKSDISKQVGQLIAEKAKESKIEEVIFDRGGNLFHGRVKALADGAREAGLKF
ncbi:MAG: 50S ribosomal protein L18 [Candidatus Staskawiczbacteria bacterium]|jgi:large subunit ribosomal protein L18